MSSILNTAAVYFSETSARTYHTALYTICHTVMPMLTVLPTVQMVSLSNSNPELFVHSRFYIQIRRRDEASGFRRVHKAFKKIGY